CAAGGTWHTRLSCSFTAERVPARARLYRRWLASLSAARFRHATVTRFFATRPHSRQNDDSEPNPATTLHGHHRTRLREGCHATKVVFAARSTSTTLRPGPE